MNKNVVGIIRQLIVAMSLTALICGSAFAEWATDPLVNTPIINEAGNQNGYSMVADGHGGFIMAWSDDRDTNNPAIYAQRVDERGNILWKDGGILIKSKYGSRNGGWGNSIVSDGNGGAIIAWSEMPKSWTQSFSVGLQHIDSMGNFLWGSSGIEIVSQPWEEISFWAPSLIADGAGGVIAIWQTSTYTGYPRIYAQRVGSNGTFQWGNGNSRVLLSQSLFDFFRGALSDGHGGAFVLVTAKSDSNILHLDENGNSISNNAIQQIFYSSIVPDPSGGFFTIGQRPWNSAECPNCINMQKFDESGIKLWGDNGIAIPYSEGWFGGSAYTVFVSDGSGGFFATWMGGDSMIHAQLINSIGIRLWGETGKRIANSNYSQYRSQYRPSLLKTDNGKFIISWMDMRNGNYDIYAQKLDSEGNLLWGDEGLSISKAPNTQAYPTIINDNGDGAIVFWADYRSGTNWDIYAQQISSDGLLGVPSISIQSPTNLTSTDALCDNGGSITLTWTLSPGDGSKVTGYRIYRSTTSGGTYGLIGNVSSEIGSYTDNTAITGTTYYYVVSATDGTNESANSNEASAASIRNLPLPPTSVTASDTPYDLGGSISLTWTKSIDDGAGLNNVLSYNIYRYSSVNGNIVALASVPAGTTNYADKTTADTDTYYYFIKALDSPCNMESTASDIVSGQSINNMTALPGFIETFPGISPEMLNSTTSKVENAIASLDRGNEKAAINTLNALLNEIEAQSGKKIDTATAEMLKTYIQNLINYIQSN